MQKSRKFIDLVPLLYIINMKNSCIIVNSKNIICNMQVAQNTRHFIIYDLKYIIFVFLYI